MNSIKGMIEDLEREDTHIGGCTTEGEIITVLRNLENCICITPSATNGDMIMAMFPNASVNEISGGATIVVSHTYKFNSTWWNAPYERGES